MLSFYSVCCCESFDILLVNMVGSRPRNQYRKTKKGKGFSGVPKWSKRREEILPNEDENAGRNSTPTPSTSSRGSSHLHSEDKPTSSSASRKKLSDHGFKDDSSGSSSDETEDLVGHGYRLLDINNLSSTLFDIHKCDEGKLSRLPNICCVKT